MTGPFECGVCIGDFFFSVHILERLFGCIACVLVLENVLRQRFEAFLACDRCLGAALGTEGQVDVFEF